MGTAWGDFSAAVTGLLVSVVDWTFADVTVFAVVVSAGISTGELSCTTYENSRSEVSALADVEELT
jgi:hypothetical protein